jgi:hypothetical protein
LIGLNPHFVAGNFLVILLAQNGDHIKRGASGESGSDQFDRLGTCPPSRIIEQKIMPTPRASYKLATLRKWLRKFNFRGNHKNPPAESIGKEHE